MLRNRIVFIDRESERKKKKQGQQMEIKPRAFMKAFASFE